MSERRTRSPELGEDSVKRRRLVSLSPSPPAVFKGKEKAVVKVESDNEADQEGDVEDDDDDDNCPICLQPHKQRAMVPTCSHEFCLECIVVWCDQSRRCPLCQGNIGDYLIYNIRSRHDFQKYFLTPLFSSSPKLTPLASARPRRPRRRRPERRWGIANEGDEEEDRLDRSMVKRRWVYRHRLFAKHVASNTYTKFRPFPTPQQFSGNADMVRRATAFIRRELTCVLGLMGQEQGDIEFLTSFTISIMKSLDIRSEGAIKLLAEFLDLDGGMERAEQFAHEVYSYLRSPYQDMFVYDSVVQYDVPPDATGAMPERTDLPPAEELPVGSPEPPSRSVAATQRHRRPSRSRSRSQSHERPRRNREHRSHRQPALSRSRSPESKRISPPPTSRRHARPRRDESRSPPRRSRRSTSRHRRRETPHQNVDHYSPPRRGHKSRHRSPIPPAQTPDGVQAGAVESKEETLPDTLSDQRILSRPVELAQTASLELVQAVRTESKPIRKRFHGLADTVSAHLSLPPSTKRVQPSQPEAAPEEKRKKTLEERLTSPRPEAATASVPTSSSVEDTASSSASTEEATTNTDKRAELLQRLMRERRNRSKPQAEPAPTQQMADIERERKLKIQAKLQKEKREALTGSVS